MCCMQLQGGLMLLLRHLRQSDDDTEQLHDPYVYIGSCHLLATNQHRNRHCSAFVGAIPAPLHCCVLYYIILHAIVWSKNYIRRQWRLRCLYDMVVKLILCYCSATSCLSMLLAVCLKNVNAIFAVTLSKMWYFWCTEFWRNLMCLWDCSPHLKNVTSPTFWNEVHP